MPLLWQLKNGNTMRILGYFPLFGPNIKQDAVNYLTMFNSE
jgi:hypothetical protein